MIEPMLARTAQPSRLQQLLNDDTWAIEQKIDGKRMLVQVADREARAFNRTAQEIECPEYIAADFDGKPFEAEWLFDGEYLNNTYYVFDCIMAPVSDDWHQATFGTRRDLLERLFGRIRMANTVLVPQAQGLHMKTDLFKKIKDNRGEGVMFKNLNARYTAGVRSHDMLKWKFVETADVVVTETFREGKDQAISIGIYHDGQLVDAGGCKIPTNLVGVLQPQDVIECKYLYGTKDHKLYQPVFLKVRDDKPAGDCTTEQLKYGNPAVLV